MWSLIQFDVKRKYRNPAVLVYCIVLFIVSGLLIHLDKIWALFQPDALVSIYLEPSVVEYQEYFKDTEFVYFQTDNKEADAHLVLEDDWKLYCEKGIRQDVIDSIEQQIQQIPIEGKKEIHRPVTHQLFVSESKIPDYSMELILITVLYFMLLSKSSNTVYDILTEKNNGMLDLYLTSISAQKHLLAKIIVNWVKSGIDFLIGFLFTVFWIMIRFGFGNAFEQWTHEQISFENSYFDGSLVLAIVFTMVVGLVLSQVLITLYICKVQNKDEAEKLNFPIQVMCILLYYVCFYMYQQGWYGTIGGNLLSFIPFANTLSLPMSLVFNRNVTGMIQLGMIMSVVLVVLVIRYGGNVYKNRILNIKKQSRYFNLRN